jgi:hypothetical protein
MQILLAPFSVEQVRVVSRRNPLAAFRLAQLQLTNGNRQGRVDSSDVWSRLSGELLCHVTASERGLDLKAAHWNREIVQRNGRYDFRTELPEAIREMMESLKEFDRLKRRHSPEAISLSLAKLYGTIAQNYGFCGPRYLREVQQHVALAQQAFGGGAVREAVDDWRRQFGYLFYALLDAGETEQAGEALREYTGLSPPRYREKDLDGLNPYQHAAIARFAAESGKVLPEYLKWVSRRVFDIPIQHPWQLWLNNAGLFLDGGAMKRAAWSRSVELSLRLGITATPVALLPLSNLWQTGLWEQSKLESQTLAVMNVFASRRLCSHHFEELREGTSWEDILATVVAYRGRLFPFTYR